MQRGLVGSEMCIRDRNPTLLRKSLKNIDVKKVRNILRREDHNESFGKDSPTRSYIGHKEKHISDYQDASASASSTATNTIGNGPPHVVKAAWVKELKANPWSEAAKTKSVPGGPTSTKKTRPHVLCVDTLSLIHI
eukprot:TRINITY_DN25445_c0_g1_i3.p2 TRINITY_DN25445_c0_g1~~TRINITY_DN25445_c0_g1_i3.p2  ORF type:complete len:136 (+),score=21.96 TRINITY_DN25445_c0_g1_i3:105-512(+)